MALQQQIQKTVFPGGLVIGHENRYISWKVHSQWYHEHWTRSWI